MTEKTKAAGAQIILDEKMPTVIRRGPATIEFNQSGGIIVRSDGPVTLKPADAQAQKPVEAQTPIAPAITSALPRENYNPSFQIDPAAARRGKHPAGGGMTSSITSAP